MVNQTNVTVNGVSFDIIDGTTTGEAMSIMNMAEVGGTTACVRVPNGEPYGEPYWMARDKAGNVEVFEVGNLFAAIRFVAGVEDGVS